MLLPILFFRWILVSQCLQLEELLILVLYERIGRKNTKYMILTLVRRILITNVFKYLYSFTCFMFSCFNPPSQADWPGPMPAIGRIANFSSLRRNRPHENQIYDSYFGKILLCLFVGV